MGHDFTMSLAVVVSTVVAGCSAMRSDNGFSHDSAVAALRAYHPVIESRVASTGVVIRTIRVPSEIAAMYKEDPRSTMRLLLEISESEETDLAWRAIVAGIAVEGSSSILLLDDYRDRATAPGEEAKQFWIKALRTRCERGAE